MRICFLSMIYVSLYPQADTRYKVRVRTKKDNSGPRED